MGVEWGKGGDGLKLAADFTSPTKHLFFAIISIVLYQANKSGITYIKAILTETIFIKIDNS